MKRHFIWLIILTFLAGCTRTLPKSPSVTTTTATPTAFPASATVMPSLDLSLFPEKFPDSMKGYELVSWQEDGDWWFTLVTGTNRQKSFEELTSPQSWIIPDEFIKVTTSSLTDLKGIIERMPSESELLWGGMELSGEVAETATYFTYPPTEIQNEIAGWCDKYRIKLVRLADLE
jgi:hypothetical protein